MSSITPVPVPPMSPDFRVRLYGIFSWLALSIATALAIVGSAIGLGVDVPQEIPTWLAVAQTGVGTAWGYLGFVAKANVPERANEQDTDPDLEVG